MQNSEVTVEGSIGWEYLTILYYIFTIYEVHFLLLVSKRDDVITIK